MKKLKVNEILFYYNLIKDASIGQVKSKDDRRNLLHDAFVLKGVIDSFDALQQDAINKHKGPKHDELIEKFQLWRESERNGKDVSLTPEERNEVAKYVADFDKAVNECLEDDFQKEHELDIKLISEDSFDEFTVDKPWSIEQAMKLYGLLVKTE